LPVSVAYVMVAQALSGVAKDLTKMSSKSAVKLLVKGDDQTLLFKWVALLTGSKNALKGLGFLLGGVLLGWLGFAPSLWLMAALLAIVLAACLLTLKQDMGKSKEKVKLQQLFAKSREINILSLARMFLFSSRDVWFVVGLPVFLYETLGWSFSGVGAFLAAWVIGYGGVQAFAPRLLRRADGATDVLRAAQVWGFTLGAITGGIALALQFQFHPTVAILGGLSLFAVAFAINSSVHSYLILAYTDSDKVALNVGFYYMANAIGRLLGTLLSGLMFMIGGLPACLWVSTGLVLAAAALTLCLPAIRFAPVGTELAAIDS
jgi:predicted MFS family arabinose efflux permease